MLLSSAFTLPSNIVDLQFQVYTGLLVNKNQIGGHESDSDDDEDDADEENFYETNTMTPQAGAVETDPSRGVIPDSVHNKNLIQDEVDTEKNAQRLPTPHKSARADKLSIFLNDPEKSIQIFLSSQVKRFGVIWWVWSDPLLFLADQ